MTDKKTGIRFGNIATFRNGLNYNKESKGKGCLFIGVSNFHAGLEPKYDELSEINPTGIASEEDYLQKGDILFVRSNGNKRLVGRSLFVGKNIEALYSGFCIRARVTSNKFSAKFCAYFTKTKRFRSLITPAGSTNINNLNQGTLGNVILPQFSLKEQQKIVDTLYLFDAKINLNNRINAELESMAKTIYDYWFVQFDFPDENGRPYKSSGGKMVYNEVLKREIPEGWGDDSLWNIADYFNGLAMQKHRPAGKDFLRVIKIKEMTEGYSSKTEKASPSINPKAIVENGDVLFSWSATLEVQIWSKGKGALNQHIFKVTSEKYPRSYYYFELKNYLRHFKMLADKRKTTMGHITQDHLKQSRVVIPPITLIERLDEKLKPIFSQHMLLEQENRQLIELRDWLLPMLMNGQVTVK
ncbi:type I restriction enzyme, S subunit [Mariprofundus micogutta]|uniref:Type I restriction enzyme, S subunit n=1 Tax=Mariprofundus micogutta TaxID=1921010 RepID=A0A1L8CRH3_9PROT|nr:restriction endonuclease subunit S [Mariprofundus micogutta]GAV21429.1 type I restriction enzyme, S subunit [Mariprofundus micogutta]